MSATPAMPPTAEATLPIGRTFFHPAVDYLLIGGLISVPFIAMVGFDRSLFPLGAASVAIAIMVNYAHFSASTVRLYTRPGLAKSMPFLAWGFPILWAALTIACLVFADLLAHNFWKLYQSWSPYHYAAQTFGICMMYAGRSGVKLGGGARSWLWWVCMLPFAWAFVTGANESGLAWFVDMEALRATPILGTGYDVLGWGLAIASFAVPIAFFFTAGRRMPLIAIVLVATNALWWTFLSYDDAWAWAAIAHSIQYLLIVGVFDARDHVPEGQSRVRRGLVFYALCVLLGILMFVALPVGVAIGFGMEMTVAVQVLAAGVILHHFIVDGFIWRRKRVGVG